MSSSLDMSLDDLAKQHRSSGSSRGGRGGSRGASSSARGGSSQNGSGPIRNKQRHSGGGAPAPRQQQQPYARVSTPLQYAAPLAYTSAAPAGKWQRDLYQSPEPQQIQQPVKKLSGDTIHVSNLASDVSDDDVREIFERIGAVKSCTVNYNRDGKSTGTATVTFARKNDAEKAVEDYDDAEVDGRPMKLKLVGSVVSAPVVVKKQKPQVVQQQQPQAAPQLAFLPQQIFQQPLQYAQSYQQQPRQSKPAAPRGGATATRGGRGGRDGAPSAPSAPRGGAQSGRGGRGGKAASAPREKKEVSGADLDAELDSYHKQREAAAAPAAAAPDAGQPTTV